jgi:hypothetical protein
LRQNKTTTIGRELEKRYGTTITRVCILANAKVFTGCSTGQATLINERNDIVRLEELNLGLRLPHSCGTDETGVQLLRNKALVDSNVSKVRDMNR